MESKHNQDQAVPDATVKLTSHTIHYESPSGNASPLPAARCTCGWEKVHANYQVCYRKAFKHSLKTGHVMLRKV